MADEVAYSRPGVFTNLGLTSPAAVEDLSEDPAEVALLVSGLVIQPRHAEELGFPAERFRTNQMRPAQRLVEELLTLDSAPLTEARSPERRVVGTCRHFTVVTCALLRHQGIPARARCGFATYFQQGKAVDHWVVEYWDDGRGGWVRIDPEIIGTHVLSRPEDLAPDDFLTGGEAWSELRRGRIDPSTFGVPGTENWGASEIRGNAVRDLAALNMVEPLPWDEWGRMTDSYAGKTGPDYDELLDTLSAVCASDNAAAIASLFARDELRVPPTLMR